jgi:serine/threonine protein kinase
MSPEAIQAPESVDGRSDLYALGAVAWFLLVGRPPFMGSSVIQICARHLHETPLSPGVALGQPLPLDLEEIVLSCLEKNPDARPHDARALRAKLERCSASAAWTKERAAEFWRARAESVPPEAPSPTPRTIDLAYAARSPELGAASGARR